MPAKQDRIILDTNLWISFLLTKDYSKLDSVLQSGGVILLFSSELLEEFIEVTKRPGLKKYFSVNDIEAILATIDQYAEFIQVTASVLICRDPKDNFLLGLAKDGKASHLITGDKDLLELKKFGKTKILTIAEYFHS